MNLSEKFEAMHEELRRADKDASRVASLLGKNNYLVVKTARQIQDVAYSHSQELRRMCAGINTELPETERLYQRAALLMMEARHILGKSDELLAGLFRASDQRLEAVIALMEETALSSFAERVFPEAAPNGLSCSGIV